MSNRTRGKDISFVDADPDWENTQLDREHDEAIERASRARAERRARNQATAAGPSSSRGRAQSSRGRGQSSRGRGQPSRGRGQSSRGRPSRGRAYQGLPRTSSSSYVRATGAPAPRRPLARPSSSARGDQSSSEESSDDAHRLPSPAPRRPSSSSSSTTKPLPSSSKRVKRVAFAPSDGSDDANDEQGATDAGQEEEVEPHWETWRRRQASAAEGNDFDSWLQMARAGDGGGEEAEEEEEEEDDGDDDDEKPVKDWNTWLSEAAASDKAKGKRRKIDTPPRTPSPPAATRFGLGASSSHTATPSSLVITGFASPPPLTPSAIAAIEACRPAFPFTEPLVGSDDDDEDAAKRAADLLAQRLARALPRHPSLALTSRREQRSKIIERATLDEKLWGDETILYRLIPATRASRTGAALRELRNDVLPAGHFETLAVSGFEADGIAALRHRADATASAGAELLSNELRCSIVLAKREIGSRHEAGMISGIEMARYARGLDDKEHAAYIMARMPSRAVMYCRNWKEYEALHKANPQLDATKYHGTGTYLIVVRYIEEGVEKLGHYVGTVFDEPMSARQADHAARFAAIEWAEHHGTDRDVEDAQGKQKGLYRRQVLDTRAFILTQTPAATPTALLGEWQELLAWHLFEKSIGRMGEGNLGRRQVQRMVNSMDEHVFCALFNCIGNKGYPSATSIEGARWPRRKQEGCNGVVPVCSFADLRQRALVLRDGVPYAEFVPARRPPRISRSQQTTNKLQRINTNPKTPSLVAATNGIPSHAIASAYQNDMHLIQQARRERLLAQGVSVAEAWDRAAEMAAQEDPSLVAIADVEEPTTSGEFITNVDWVRIVSRRDGQATSAAAASGIIKGSSSSRAGPSRGGAGGGGGGEAGGGNDAAGPSSARLGAAGPSSARRADDGDGDSGSDDSADERDTVVAPNNGARIAVGINEDGRSTVRAAGLGASSNEPRTITRVSAFSDDLRRRYREDLVHGHGILGHVIDGGRVIHFSLPGNRIFRLSLRHVRGKFVDGRPASIKIRAKEDDRELQAMAASPEAAFVLAHYTVFVDQRPDDGAKARRYRYEPLAVPVDAQWDALFAYVADFLFLDDDAARLPFAQRDMSSTIVGRELHGVGVCLRYKGSRLHGKATHDGFCAVMLPGDHLEHALLGRRCQPRPKDAGARVKMVLDVVAPSYPFDVVFRAKPSTDGRYNTLQYVVRAQNADPQDGGKRIREGEWVTIRPREDGIEPWKVAFLLNVVRRTWGCKHNDLLWPNEV